MLKRDISGNTFYPRTQFVLFFPVNKIETNFKLSVILTKCFSDGKSYLRVNILDNLFSM